MKQTTRVIIKPESYDPFEWEMFCVSMYLCSKAGDFTCAGPDIYTQLFVDVVNKKFVSTIIQGETATPEDILKVHQTQEKTIQRILAPL